MIAAANADQRHRDGCQVVTKLQQVIVTGDDELQRRAASAHSGTEKYRSDERVMQDWQSLLHPVGIESGYVAR